MPRAARRSSRRRAPEPTAGLPASVPAGAVGAPQRRGGAVAPPMPRAELPLIARARPHASRAAIVAAEGTFTYQDLLEASGRVAACLLDRRSDLVEARVAFLAPAGWHYVATQWGIWRAGGVAVPLGTSHPPAELEHVIRDSEAEIVVVHADFLETIRGLDTVKG